MFKASKLFPMYFPVMKRCFTCQREKVASAVQILPNSFTNRQLYFCPDCATEKGFPPSKHLLKRLQEVEETQAKVKSMPGQKQKKAVTGDRKK